MNRIPIKIQMQIDDVRERSKRKTMKYTNHKIINAHNNFV